MRKATMIVRLPGGGTQVSPIQVDSHRARDERERQVDLRVRVMHAIGEALRDHPECESIDIHIQNRPPALRVVGTEHREVFGADTMAGLHGTPGDDQ